MNLLGLCPARCVCPGIFGDVIFVVRYSMTSYQIYHWALILPNALGLVPPVSEPGSYNSDPLACNPPPLCGASVLENTPQRKHNHDL